MAKMTDRVLALAGNPEQIRNIAICAHIDHGKTTFSDNLLSGAGMMSEELAGQARQLDFHEDEAARGITIDSAAVSMVHGVKGKDFLINLIDTPGHVDFGGDVSRAMRAVDGCIVLVDSVEGIMPQTETVLRQALKERVKPILFINKADRLVKELKLNPAQIQERLTKIIINVNKKIRDIAEPQFQDAWSVDFMNGSVCIGSAIHNWALSADFMKEKGVNFKNIIDAYEGGEHKTLAKLAPLHEVVLNAVVKHHPNPTISAPYKVPRIWPGDVDSPVGQSLVKCDPKGPVVFIITKMVIDPQAGEICYGRLFSGTIRKGEQIRLIRAKQDARIQQVFVPNGAKRDIVDLIPAGNICVISGMRGAYPGETVTTQADMEPFIELLQMFDPVITKAIEAAKPSDLPRLVEVLVQVTKEDPSIKIQINQETGEHLMSGMGELHLEIIENRIKTEKHLEIKTSPPVVVYRESIQGKSGEDAEGKSPNKHNRLYFRAEVLPASVIAAFKEGSIPQGRVKKKTEQELWAALEEAGMESKMTRQVRHIYNGNILIDSTRGIVQIGEIQELVNDMFEDVMNKGPVAGEPCQNVLVMLTDAKLHEDAIHRGPAQMYPAVRDGIRIAMRAARPFLLEPVQTLLFEAPEEFVGEISKLVSNKRGQLLDMTQEGTTVQVKARIPVGEMFGMSNQLRSATGGRGSSSVVDQNYDRLPEELQSKITTQIRTRKGLKEDVESTE
jgi:elongation factor 2